MPDERMMYPAADFQALPLEFIVATPLLATVKAQAAAAVATRQFIEGLCDPPASGGARAPIMVSLRAQFQDSSSGQTREATVEAPLLALVPVPHLRIDALTVSFRYEVTQTIKNAETVDKGIEFEAGTSDALSHFVRATLKGNLSAHSTREEVANRSGSLEISLHASESEIPAGLSKLLDLLSQTITVTPPEALAPASSPPGTPTQAPATPAAGGTS